MKPTTHNHCRKFLPIGSILLASALAANGANITWDTSTDPGVQGGGGTWNTSLENWTTDGGTSNVAWNNANNDTAIFDTSAGTVTLGENITAASLSFGLNGYTIALGGNNLTLTGTATTIGGTGTRTISGAGSIILGANQTFAGGNGTISSNINLNGNNLILDTGGDNARRYTGVISGNGNLTVNSTYSGTNNPGNTQPLGTANTFTGTFTFGGSILIANVGSGIFGNASNNIVFNNNTGFRATGGGTTTRNVSFLGNAQLWNNSGSSTFDGPITGSGTLTARGNYTGGNGPGGFTLGAANPDFTGTVTAGNDGHVNINHPLAVENATLNAVANARVAYALQNNRAFVIGALAGNTALNFGSGADATGGGIAGVVQVGNKGTTTTYSGVLSGTAEFRKIGSGTLTLNAANTFTSTTRVAEGALKLGAAGSLASTTIEVSPGAFLDVTDKSGGYAIAEDQTLAGSGTVTGAVGFLAGSSLGIADIDNPLTITGTVTFAPGWGLANITGWDYQNATPATYTVLLGDNIDTTGMANLGIDNALTLPNGNLAYIKSGSLQVVVIPESSSILLGGLWLLALLRRRR